MMYEHPNYMGYQYFMRRGEYPDYQRWMGFNDSIRSCRMIPQRLRILRLQLHEMSALNLSSRLDGYWINDIHSCNVMDGYWIMYEQPNYRGRQYFMRPEEYRRYSDWGGMSSRIGSFRRITD
ncbi:CRGS1 protein, partial [Polyodon spathula]|nr:CRGS1 protein [Polyodon spathula]